jgi:hypothetical protein
MMYYIDFINSVGSLTSLTTLDLAVELDEVGKRSLGALLQLLEAPHHKQ